MDILTRWALHIITRKCPLRPHHDHMSYGLNPWNSRETADDDI